MLSISDISTFETSPVSQFTIFLSYFSSNIPLCILENFIFHLLALLILHLRLKFILLCIPLCVSISSLLTLHVSLLFPIIQLQTFLSPSPIFLRSLCNASQIYPRPKIKKSKIPTNSRFHFRWNLQIPLHRSPSTLISNQRLVTRRSVSIITPSETSPAKVSKTTIEPFQKGKKEQRNLLNKPTQCNSTIHRNLLPKKKKKRKKMQNTSITVKDHCQRTLPLGRNSPSHLQFVSNPTKRLA